MILLALVTAISCITTKPKTVHSTYNVCTNGNCRVTKRTETTYTKTCKNTDGSESIEYFWTKEEK